MFPFAFVFILVALLSNHLRANAFLGDFQGTALSVDAEVDAPDFVEAIPGDLNLDGNVDFSDFLVFASNFGKSGPVPSPARPQTITVRDTIEIVRVDTITVAGSSGQVGSGFWQGPVVFAEVDVQMGGSDGFNSGTLSVDASTNQTVSIDIFARGFDGAVAGEAIFRVSDPSMIYDITWTSEVFPIDTKPGFDFNNLHATSGAFVGIPESGTGLKYYGSLNFRTRGPLELAFISFQIAWSPTDKDVIYPNVMINIR